MTTTIAVAGLVGGTGKTTLIANLAATLATHYQQRVLAVDLSTFNHLLQQFAINGNNHAYYLDDPLQVGAAGIEQYILAYAPLLHLLPGTNPQRPYPPIYGPQEDGIWLRLKKGFQRLQESYDFILLDAPVSADQFSIRACALADRVLIPTGNNRNELRHQEELLAQLAKVQQEYELTAQQVRIVLHCGELGQESYDTSYQQNYRRYLLETVINQSPVVVVEPGRPQPTVLRHPNSQIAKEYAKLAQEIIAMAST